MDNTQGTRSNIRKIGALMNTVEEFETSSSRLGHTFPHVTYNLHSDQSF